MKKRIYTRGTAIDRIIEHIVLLEDGCWIYDGARTPAGYGHVNIGNRKYRHAHRITCEHFVEPLADGMELDHLCRVRACANPWHLEQVTHRENVLRGQAPNIILHISGMCKRGHIHTGAVNKHGHRGNCPVCRKEKRDSGEWKS